MWKRRAAESAMVQGCVAGIILLAIVTLVGGWLGLVVGGLWSVVVR